MIKTLKKWARFLLLIIIILMLFLVRVELSFYAKKSTVFLFQMVDIIDNRISDITHYLVMQKRYIFDNFTDPNVYLSFKKSINLEKVLSLFTYNEIDLNTDKPIFTENFVLPKINNPNAKGTVSGQFASPEPALIIKSNKKSNLNYFDSISEILYFTNKEREIMSLKPLEINKDLNIIADMRINDLFTKQYFEHISPDGKSAPDLAKLVGYNYSLIGENLALGNFDSNEEIVSAWMESPGHMANILNDRYQALGVAVKEGDYNGEKATIAVQIFAQPQNSCIMPNQKTRELIDTSSVAIKEMQSEALDMYNYLNNIKNKSQIDQAYYKQKVQEYNYFAQKINASIPAIQKMIEEYNIEVTKYNTCISQ